MKKTLLVVFLVLVPFLFSGCTVKKPAKITSSTTTSSTAATTAAAETFELLTVDPATVEAGLQASYNLATQKAKDWKPEAVFYGAIMKVPKDFPKNSTTEIYIFGSPKDTQNWWTYTFDEKRAKSMRALIPKDDLSFDKNATPAKTSYWKINYLQALQAGEASLGVQGARNEPPDQIILTLANGQPRGWLWWVLEYIGADGKIRKARLDPASGQPADESGNLLTSKKAVGAAGNEFLGEEEQGSEEESFSTTEQTTPTQEVPTGGIASQTIWSIRNIFLAALALFLGLTIIYFLTWRKPSAEKVKKKIELDIPF